EWKAAREALAALAPAAGAPRAWAALGIAHQRLGEHAEAEAAFDRALLGTPAESSLRLNRGALRARRLDFDGARADFEPAGERHEARWNRAALRVLETVATTSGPAPRAAIEAARTDAGAPSSYWSDHTVGRLLFSALVERSHREYNASAEAELRDAEQWMEFDTFWDRALILHGYASLALATRVEALASEMAHSQLVTLRAEPPVRGASGSWIAAPLEAVAADLEHGEPAVAARRLATLMELPALRHYRVPCVACGRGALGVEACEEESEEFESE
ncbi:MAG: hypothetical protein HOP12_01345, partial [Candidatus Eisenbacteria bacterium]|nr:hypothetical protein [Candidatus Eisenbacteria bacterium]